MTRRGAAVAAVLVVVALALPVPAAAATVVDGLFELPGQVLFWCASTAKAEGPKEPAAKPEPAKVTPSKDGAAQPAPSAGKEGAASAPGTFDLDVVEDFRPSLVHGDKGAEFQRYIVLHDTEGEGSPQSVVDYWDGNGNLVAAHFVVGKDGTVVQCVPLDKIAHHAGYGDAGHNALYGVEDESRDDKAGTVPIGDWAPDYGMNSYSIGIELVHVGGSGEYPQAQLDALDALIAAIDGYYGFESPIIDHKAWRSGNSDTSPEFAAHLASYKERRVHA